MRPHRISILLILAGGYYLAGKLGLQLAVVNPNATAVWAPTGISLAALLLLGYRAWPAIFAGAFLVNLDTAGEFLKAGACAVAVGGELVDAKTIKEGRFDIIEDRARQYLAVIAKARAEM